MVWNFFTLSVKKQGYNQGQSDHTSFIKCNLSGIIYLLIVYDNYIVLAEDDETKIEKLMRNLPAKFEIKDFRSLEYYILGKEATRSRMGYQYPMAQMKIW